MLWNDESRNKVAELYQGERLNRIPAILQYLDDLVDIGKREGIETMPTNVRHIYYKMVSYGIIEADKNQKRTQYQKISRDLTDLRDEGIVPWEMISDLGRREVEKRGIGSIQIFADEQLKTFLNPQYYHRCRIQSQDVYMEILTEKEALAGQFENAIWPYCVRMTVVKGQNSATKVNELAERMEEAYYKGKTCIVICFNDLDPTGWAIPKAIRNRLRDKHGLDETQVWVERGGLNPQHIVNSEALLHLYYAPKPKDNNLIQWIVDFAHCSYEEAQAMSREKRVQLAMQANVRPTELDAMDVVELNKMITETIESHLVMDEFYKEMEIEKSERKELIKARHVVAEFCGTTFPELFSK